MLMTIGAIVLLSIISTTPESRAQGKRDVAKWNPVFIIVGAVAIAIIVIG